MRHEKLPSYRHVPSLQHVLLVASERVLIEHWRRFDVAWRQETRGAGDTLRLDALGIELPVDEIYAGLGLEAGGSLSQGRPSCRTVPGAERLLDAQALVPLRHALGAREAADLELGNAPADREVHDGHVLGLARAGRDDRAVARFTRRLPAGEGLAHRADLVRLEQHGVAGAVGGLRARVRRGDEEVVADHLHAAPSRR